MHYLLTAADACVAGRRDDQSYFVFDDGFKNQWSHKNKSLHHVHPHGTAYNHFSSTNVCDYAGQLVFGLTLTDWRD